jgi:hypothetical protein
MVQSAGRWLSVAVHTPAREDDEAEIPPARLVDLTPPGPLPGASLAPARRGP